PPTLLPDGSSPITLQRADPELRDIGRKSAPGVTGRRSCFIGSGSADHPAEPAAHEAGPESKPTLSTSSDAFLRYLAMLSSGSGSGLSGPQLCTISDGATFGFTGYSLLAEA